MSYKVSSIPLFDKQALRLAKKYPSLKNDLATLIDSLENMPQQGKALGSGFYKIRLMIASKRTGKSGGARIITYVKVVNATVFLTSIYDNSDKSTISDKELAIIFKLLP